jgi:DGQHR domain-containing protein
MRYTDVVAVCCLVKYGETRMTLLTLPAKANKDNSYSVSISAKALSHHAFVDYYEDKTREGYQRLEATRQRRARDIAEYIRRCRQRDLVPRLFEMTANARLPEKNIRFEAATEDGSVGTLIIEPSDERWLSIIDGGTRLGGVDVALRRGSIDDDFRLDMRLFVGLRIGEEVAQFLLINEKQKKVRTDLSIRVVQTKNDEGSLSKNELAVLTTVVPDKESWKYEASAIAGYMNESNDSPWKGLIQMPGSNDRGMPIKLMAFLSSLRPILADKDLGEIIEKFAEEGDTAQLVQRILVNFWNAVAGVNPEAHQEPETNVLWGSIGVSACHMALSSILLSVLQSNRPDLSKERFVAMLDGTTVSEYSAWFSRKGARAETHYPGEKGEMTMMTGAANYKRVADNLEKEWRAALYRDMTTERQLVL